jgi:hypothetical protein
MRVRGLPAPAARSMSGRGALREPALPMTARADRGPPDLPVDDDGGLRDSLGCIEWSPDEAEAVLDGHFTADLLRRIADHMDAHRRWDGR